MLQFEKKLVITGAEQRVRKDNTAYTLVHILLDNGTTCSCVYKGDINKIMSLKPLEKYPIQFELSVGQYTRLSVTDIVL